MPKRFRRVIWSAAFCLTGGAIISFPMTGWPGIIAALFSLVCLVCFSVQRHGGAGGPQRWRRSRGR